MRVHCLMLTYLSLYIYIYIYIRTYTYITSNHPSNPYNNPYKNSYISLTGHYHPGEINETGARGKRLFLKFENLSIGEYVNIRSTKTLVRLEEMRKARLERRRLRKQGNNNLNDSED